MTEAEHLTRCTKELYADATFAAQLLPYGIHRERLYCIVGHSVYLDVAAPEAPVRPVPVKWDSLCERCEETFDTGPNGRRFCDPCRKIRQVENLAMNATKNHRGGYRPSRFCTHCQKTLEPGQYRFCGATCRETRLTMLAGRRIARKEERMAGAFA